MTGRRTDEDFAREIEAHMAIEADRLIADGVDPVEAADRARRAFGNVTRTRERYYESRRIAWLDDLRRDVRTACRNIRRAPIAAIVIVLSLAAGIGSATAALVVRNVIFYNPPPLYRAPSELLRVQAAPSTRPILPAGGEVPAALFAEFRRDLPSPIAGATSGRPAEVTRSDGTDIVPVRAVTPNLFTLLGVPPIIGRTFDDRSSGDGSAILSFGVWQRLFGGRREIIGTELAIDGRPFTVIGVMPERFWFTNTDAPVWLALDDRQIASSTSLQVVVRAADARAVESGLQSSLRAHNQRRPRGEQALHIRVSPLRGTPMGDQMSLVIPYILGVAVLLTLCIGCANAAILLIAQWTARETETAVRSSLGAGRARLVRALLTESVVLSLAAGVACVVVALAFRWWITRDVIVAQTLFDLSVPPRVLAQSLLLAFAAGLVAGVAPALYETARLQMNPLRGLQASDVVRQRWSHALVVLEVAVTVALLVVASSMVAGYQRLQDAAFGFDPHPLAVAGVSNPDGVAIDALLAQVAGVPGVAAASVASSVPLYWPRVQQRVAAGRTSATIQAQRIAVSPSYFSALGVAMRAGRAFDRRDVPEARGVIVNETLARELFGTTAGLGRQLVIDGETFDIRGVVADYAGHFEDTEVPAPKFFVPLPPRSRPNESLAVLIRAEADPAPVIQPVQRAIRLAAPGNTVRSTFTYDQIMRVTGQEWLAAIAPLGPLITIGMLMTAAGIYGVLAFAINRRTRELAVRIALGATPGDQILLVAMRSLRLIVAGAGVGVALTFALSRVVRASGGAGSMYDPPWAAFVVPVLIIIGIGAAATWLPTRRARRIDPAALLRSM
jgi:predicted permease